jgi:hypothetical protein
MSHPFAGFPPHFEECSNLFGIGENMVVAAIGLMYGIPVVNYFFVKKVFVTFLTESDIIIYAIVVDNVRKILLCNILYQKNLFLS